MTQNIKFNIVDFDPNRQVVNFSTQETVSTWIYNDIHVRYHQRFNGGGAYFGTQLVHLIPKLYPNRKFNNAFEWCAGPGFIGFALLSNDICQNLYLGDINPTVLEDCLETKKHLPSKYQHNIVETILMSKTTDIDPSKKFDLIVANPPHFNRSSKVYDSGSGFSTRLFVDENWAIHKEFFTNVKQYLEEDGSIVLQESYFGSGPDTFFEMIEQADLKISRYIDTNKDNLYPLYYLEIKHK